MAILFLKHNIVHIIVILLLIGITQADRIDVGPSYTITKIQTAIDRAKDGDTINVFPGTYMENIHIDKSLVINGAGKDKTIVDGRKAGPVFRIGDTNPSANVYIYGINIQNGLSHEGGGISNDGILSVIDSIIFRNNASYGGGIYNGGTATLTNSTVSGNTANSEGGNGGGILNLDNGKLRIQGANISGNFAYWNGGGIANSGTITVIDSIISENIANLGEGALFNGGYGGGIFNYRITGDPNRNLAILKIIGSTISKNTADLGGGIYNDGTIMISNGTLINENAANVGAGISNWINAGLTIRDAIISENIANYNGGGIENDGMGSTVTFSTISGNIAKNGFGGGIYNYRDLLEGGTLIPSINVTDSTISKNIANLGGGIFNYGEATLTGSTISENVANSEGGEGGGIFNTEDYPKFRADRKLIIRASIISGNSAYWNGGGIANMGKVTVTSSTLFGNTAIKGKGGGIHNYGNFSKGTWTSAILSLANGTILNNTANTGGGIYNDGTASLDDSNISENRANSGGGIYSDMDGLLTVQGASTIFGNIAANGHGGGIYNDGNLFIGGTSQLINNLATKGYGGGIFSEFKSVTIEGKMVAVKRNTAYMPVPSELSWYRGWGIYVNTGTPIATGGFNPETQVTDNILYKGIR